LPKNPPDFCCGCDWGCATFCFYFGFSSSLLISTFSYFATYLLF
jgi:hypothetical protein